MDKGKGDPTTVAYWEAFWRRRFGPRPGGINWHGPNAWTAFGFVFALVVSRLPAYRLPFGWTWSDAAPPVFYLFAFLSSRVSASYQAAICEFLPRSTVDAKRANEQIKATAGLLNAAAAATLSIFALSEIVRSAYPNWTNIILAGGAAFWVHLNARKLLGYLVDETVPT